MYSKVAILSLAAVALANADPPAQYGGGEKAPVYGESSSVESPPSYSEPPKYSPPVYGESSSVASPPVYSKPPKYSAPVYEPSTPVQPTAVPYPSETTVESSSSTTPVIYTHPIESSTTCTSSSSVPAEPEKPSSIYSHEPVPTAPVPKPSSSYESEKPYLPTGYPEPKPSKPAEYTTH